MSFGNIKAERAAIETTYEDSCDVIREAEKEAGSLTKTAAETVYVNIPCALSTGNSPTNQTETVNNIAYCYFARSLTFFCRKFGKKIEG